MSLKVRVYLVVAVISSIAVVGLFIRKNQEEHLNSLERIFYEFRDSIPNGCPPNGYRRLDDNIARYNNETIWNEHEDSDKDKKYTMVIPCRDTIYYVCGNNICPCSEEAGGDEFQFIFENNSMQFSSESARRTSYAIYYISGKGEEIGLPIETIEVNNKYYPSFTLKLCELPYPKKSKLRIDKIRNNDLIETTCFYLDYDPDRGNAFSYVGDLKISNKPFGLWNPIRDIGE